MGKLIDKGWKKYSDSFYKEDWTMSVSLGIKAPSEKKSGQGVEKAPDSIDLKAVPKKTGRKRK